MTCRYRLGGAFAGISSQNKRKALFSSLALAAALVPRLGWAGPNSWIAGPGEWSDGSNWSNGVPGSGDDAINTTGAAIDFNTNDSVNSFTTNGAFTLTGGTISGSQSSAASPFEVDNSFTFNGGGLSNATLVQGIGGSVLVSGNGSNYINASILNADISFGSGYMQFYNGSSASADLNLAGGQIELHDGNASISLTSTGELDGYGLLNEEFGNSTLSNGGLVSADVSGQTLSLNNTNVTGSGIYQAINGATLSIGALLTGAGTIIHADTGTVQINGGGVSGTVAAATGAGLTFTGNPGNYMSNADFTGNLTFPSGGYMQVYNGNTVDGAIDMSTVGSGIELHDGNANLTLAPGALLHGYGSVYEEFGDSTLQNNGTISGDTSGQTIFINNSNLTGSGILDARNGGVVSIGAQLNGSGMQINVDSNPASAVEINGGSLTGTIGPTTGTGLTFTSAPANYMSGATVNGTLTIPSGGYVQVYNGNTANGDINMSTVGSGIELHDGNASLTLSSTALLQGYGLVNEEFSNSTLQDNGIISANVNGQILYLNNSNVTGSGILDARNGGVVSIGALLNGSGIAVNVDNTPGSAVEINGGGVTGSIGSTTGTGLSFTSSPGNYMSNAAIDGAITIPSGGYVQAYNTNSVTGNVDISTVGSGIELHDGNASFTVEAASLMHGYGLVYEEFGDSTFQNLGTVSADVNGQTLFLNNTNVTGSGILDARNGGVVSIGALLNASGMQVNVDSNPASAVEINGGGLTGTLGATTGTGLSFTSNPGNYISAATVNGTLTIPSGGYTQAYNSNTINGPIVMATTSSGIQLHDGNASLNISATGSLTGYGAVYQEFGNASVRNAGLIESNAAGQTLSFTEDNFSTAGQIVVAGGSSMYVQTTLVQTGGSTTVDGILTANNSLLLQGGTLDGTGTIDGFVNNTGGIVSPGDAPGVLTIHGPYDQGAGGEFDIQLGGVSPGSQFSQLVVAGNADIGGDLEVDPVDGFVPQIGDTFDILFSTGDSGTFATTGSNDPGLTYTVNYEPTFVEISIDTVPEPTSAAILVAGCGLMVRRRRRK